MINYLKFKGSTWSGPFLLNIVVCAIINLAFLGYIFGQFESNLNHDISATPETRTIPTYLALFIFAQIYQIILTGDALYYKNTIQVAMLVYASIQYSQIKKAIHLLTIKRYYNGDNWPVMEALIIAIPCITALSIVGSTLIGYKLYNEFGWQIYKHVGADLQLKRRYLIYLIFVSLVKFDFFFFLGFTVQFVVIVLNTKDVEFALTVAVIPITILVLWAALYFVKKENLVGMIVVISLFFAAMAYFFFKLVRMYQPSQAYKYLATRKTLVVFAILTIILLTATIANSIYCCINFNQGLKIILNDEDKANLPDDKYPLTYVSSYEQIKDQQAGRMDLD